ncbi:MAG: MFS transporter [Candidatus Pacebacteria bacterium]|nr:MFS transporter [Candidatus Paceibacterota bacterium]
MKTLLLNPVVLLYLSLNLAIELGLSFFFVTYVPFLAEKGMNLLEINIINAFFMIFVIITEMPTGSFADNFGRHRSLSLACLLLSLGFLIYFFSSSFILFICAEIILALGHTFSSGALEAWLVDSLNNRNQSQLAMKVFSIEPTFKSIGLIIGVLIGSIIGDFNLGLPWLISAIFMFIIFILSLFLKENYRQNSNKNTEKNNLKKQLTVAWRYGLRNKDLVFIMMFIACLNFSIQALNMQWPLLFQNSYNFSSFKLGWLFVGVTFSISLGGYISYRLKSIFTEKQAIIIPQVFTAIAIMLCAYSNSIIITVNLFLLHELGRGVIKPLEQDFINCRIESNNRATLLSLHSVFIKIGALLGLIISGLIASISSISLTWFLSGTSLLIFVLIFVWRYRNEILIIKSKNL